MPLIPCSRRLVTGETQSRAQTSLADRRAAVRSGGREGHSKKIFREDFKDAGVGIVSGDYKKGGKKHIFCTVHFGLASAKSLRS